MPVIVRIERGGFAAADVLNALGHLDAQIEEFEPYRPGGSKEAEDLLMIQMERLRRNNPWSLTLVLGEGPHVFPSPKGPLKLNVVRLAYHHFAGEGTSQGVCILGHKQAYQRAKEGGRELTADDAPEIIVELVNFVEHILGPRAAQAA